ncbi:hypothetical protein T439DRAFT_335164 [Meredithblackwellia eburnea MCA 4105]
MESHDNTAFEVGPRSSSIPPPKVHTNSNVPVETIRECSHKINLLSLKLAETYQVVSFPLYFKPSVEELLPHFFSSVRGAAKNEQPSRHDQFFWDDLKSNKNYDAAPGALGYFLRLDWARQHKLRALREQDMRAYVDRLYHEFHGEMSKIFLKNPIKWEITWKTTTFEPREKPSAGTASYEENCSFFKDYTLLSAHQLELLDDGARVLAGLTKEIFNGRATLFEQRIEELQSHIEMLQEGDPDERKELVDDVGDNNRRGHAPFFGTKSTQECIDLCTFRGMLTISIYWFLDRSSDFLISENMVRETVDYWCRRAHFRDGLGTPNYFEVDTVSGLFGFGIQLFV